MKNEENKNDIRQLVHHTTTPVLLPDLSSVAFVEVSNDESNYFKAKITLKDLLNINPNNSRVMYIQKREDDNSVVDSTSASNNYCSVLDQIRGHLSSACLISQHSPHLQNPAANKRHQFAESPLLRSLICRRRE